MTNMIHLLKGFSCHLRGGANHNDMIDDLQNVVQAQLENVQSMQKMYQNGDDKGLAHAVKSVIGDGTALIEDSKHFPERGQLAFPAAHLDLDAIRDLEDMPDSQITKFFQPHLFDDIAVQMQHVVTVLEDVKSIFTPSSAHRRLKASLFFQGEADGYEPFWFDQGPFEFGTKSNSQFDYGHWDFARSQDINVQKAFHQARATIHLPDISKFIHRGNDPDSVNRRLQVNERHKRRLEAMDVCQPECNSSDLSCTCDKLTGCINGMSDYDIALLFVGKYIDNEHHNFTAQLNLFDADFNIIQRIQHIRNLASSKDCRGLLPEMHSACNPLEPQCSGPNSLSFQLSVDDVCKAINNPTKLFFSSISDELDGYWGENGTATLFCLCDAPPLA